MDGVGDDFFRLMPARPVVMLTGRGEEPDRIVGLELGADDYARQRETGGVGLGLAIVRSFIESCGGTVRCRNRVPKGLEIEIMLRAVQA